MEGMTTITKNRAKFEIVISLHSVKINTVVTKNKETILCANFKVHGPMTNDYITKCNYRK